MSSGERLARVTYLPGAHPEGTPPGTTASNEAVSFAEAPPPAAEKSPVEKLTRRAENVSMHGLTRRNMSRWEMESLLKSRDLDDDLIEAELQRLEGVGLVDDAALAETLVRTQHERKGLGKQAIVSELRRRHIDQEIIDAAIEGLDADDERTRALEIAEKRAGQLSSYDRETAKRRLTAFMMRKGYSSSIVREAVDAALGSSRPGSSGGGVRFR